MMKTLLPLLFNTVLEVEIMQLIKIIDVEIKNKNNHFAQ